MQKREKKDQEVLERALEASKEDFFKGSTSSSGKDPKQGMSRASEQDNNPYAEAGVEIGICQFRKHSVGFGVLRQEFKVLKPNLS